MDREAFNSLMDITGGTKCGPPGSHDPESDEIRACLPYLHERIRIIQLSILVILGQCTNPRLSNVWGDSCSLLSADLSHQTKGWCIATMGMCHPSYLLRAAQGRVTRS